MLFRICLIAAILFGLAVGGVNLGVVQKKINDLTTERDTEHKGRLTAEDDARRTHKELAKTQADLKTTQTTLATTTDELNRTRADLKSQTDRAEKLTDDLKKTTAERDEAQSSLAAYEATGYKPPQILAMDKAYKSLQTELTEAHLVNMAQAHKIVRLTNELAKYIDTEHVVTLPANLRGKVLVADPKWNFVVVDFGEDQGAVDDGQLLVNRSGKLVAKVKISSVQKNRCIANVMPGWELGDVLEGDSVIPAYPSSS